MQFLHAAETAIFDLEKLIMPPCEGILLRIGVSSFS